MKTRFRVVGLLASAALAAATLTGCSSSNELIIATDLPLQGSSFDSNDSTNKAIELYLKQQDYKAGDYKVKLKIYDNATAAKGSWDDAKCAQNAQDHVANKNEIAVMGTYNSGCAKIIVPIINQAPGGAILMISNANTNPGLTKAWEPGEPDIYYPSGVRNYARVCTTDDNQGSAAAQFAQSIGIKSIFVLNDKIKALKPEMIYIAGIFDNNGGQLIKDKVKVLGDNTKVKVMAPDGFTGYPDFVKMPEADGVYLTFAGLSTDLLLANAPDGAGAKFVSDYKAEYGVDPVGSYPLYGVSAVQVIMAAIAASDGTREGVRNAVFSGSGVTIPADVSVLGKSITIDPATGDVDAIDITVEIVKGGAETTLQAWVLK